MIIENRFTGDVIIEADTLEECIAASNQSLQCAQLSFLDLSGMDLRHSDLRGAELVDCDLDGCDLRYASLDFTNLSGSKMRGVNLEQSYCNNCRLDLVDLSQSILSNAEFLYTDLSKVVLDDVTISWRSHDLIAELLRRNSQNDFEKLKAAGFLLVNRDKCWTQYEEYYNSYFLTLDRVIMDWAIKYLKTLVKVGDPWVPDLVANWPS